MAHKLKAGDTVRIRGKKSKETSVVKSVSAHGAIVRPTLGGFHYWELSKLELVPAPDNISCTCDGRKVVTDMSGQSSKTYGQEVPCPECCTEDYERVTGIKVA